jgi:hypothetical protein
VAFLVDTNVISELSKPSPSAVVVDWMAAQPAKELYLSSVTVTEIRYGLEMLPQGQRKVRLLSWLADVLDQDFANGVIPFRREEAELCGAILAEVAKAGRQPDIADCMIAATARLHGLAVATRNVADFATTGVQLINPWSQ